ncbi:carbohydrate ABC transporter permease [Paracoccus siganidrum]|uniref:sn-glycerol-3-phosphate transport system permease protein UgpE n=1 Tax=Paracoccus siganidrum TaxID=1276757 RepID=A0A418ZZ43_9RHOB|nr:carbohydrate ABC transporter permease [Paracoccus siganidrum]RJL05725.1 carbohydrate ABC transporter permease [Paracoccus siganidrum]RMC26996.1 carbohydrate ABC transporter permease [Paracoccus siganidrum]
MNTPYRCRPAQILSHVVLLFLAFLFLFPFYVMIVTSIRSPQELFVREFRWLPQQFTGLQYYIQAVTDIPALTFLKNGVIVSGGILFVQLLTAIPCAYALAKFQFRGRDLLFAVVLFSLTVPIQAPALPLFLGLSAIGAIDTYFAAMAPFFLSVFAIFLFRQTFRSYPDEIIQAARMDGMSEWAILWTIVVPGCLPSIAAFSVFSVVAHWNDLYWPMVVIRSTELMTPPLGLAVFADSESGANYGALMAMAAILTAPLMVGFLLAQRHFIRGITMTGVK